MTKELEPPLPRLRADAAQLDRVLDNLLHNAIRHTANGGRIRLHARRHAERVIISVEDNGEGIAYGQQGRIFEPFVQVGRKKGALGWGWRCAKKSCSCMAGGWVCFPGPGRDPVPIWRCRFDSRLHRPHRRAGLLSALRVVVAARGLPARQTAWRSAAGQTASPGRN